MHISVGAIIRQKNKILMIDRAIFPYGWACPAGHVDDNEKPDDALIREVKEEVNLDIKKFKLLINEFVDWNKCSRGVKGHNWHIFEIIEWKGEVKHNKEEVKEIKWIKPDEIKNLKLEPVWEYWFEKLSIA